MTQSNDDRPNLGAFITMIAGLLILFGALSRVQDWAKVIQPDQPLQQESDPREELRRKLEEERQRALAIYGQRAPEEMVAPQPAPVERTEPERTQPRPQRPEPVRPEPRDSHIERAAERPVPPQETTPRPVEARRYTVQPGDTLWRIAQQHYGDGHLHTWIQQCNPGLRADTLRTGQVLLLPPRPTPGVQARLRAE